MTFENMSGALCVMLVLGGIIYLVERITWTHVLFALLLALVALVAWQFYPKGWSDG